MKDLTEEDLKYIGTVEESCKILGLDNVSRKIATGEIDVSGDEIGMFKANLPDSKSKFESGNGEGVWVIPLTKEDESITKSDINGEKSQVIILNDAIYYPFPYGTILTIENRTGYRPLLNYEWLDFVIKTSSNGESCLSDMFDDED